MIDQGNDWILLPEALEIIGNGTVAHDIASIKILSDWLFDGLLKARADRVIEHQPRELDFLSIDEKIRAVSGLFDETGQSYDRSVAQTDWSDPPPPIITSFVDIPAMFWRSVDIKIDDTAWSHGRATRGEMETTRARSVYIGIKVRRPQLEAVAELHGLTIRRLTQSHGQADTSSDQSSLPVPQKGRPRGSGMYETDRAVVESVISQCDSTGGPSSIRKAIKLIIQIIEPASLDDESKIRRIREKVRKERPDLK